MTPTSDRKFEIKLSCGFVYDLWTCRIWWVLIRALKSLKNCTLMGSFSSKYLMVQLDNFRGFICHGTERWCKIQRKIDSCPEKWLNFHETSQRSESLHFDGLLLSKTYKAKIKSYRRAMSHNTKEWCKVWRKTDSWFQKLHEKFDEF